MNHFNEVCGKCGLTFGSHRGDSICNNQCPKHEGHMDWTTFEEGITVFEHTGELKEIKTGTLNKRFIDI